ncbi:MAG: hypothetical protein ACOYM2_09355 [Rectinemataceae bacterium]
MSSLALSVAALAEEPALKASLEVVYERTLGSPLSVETTAAKSGIDIQRGYMSYPPFATLDLFYGEQEGLYFHSVGEVRPQYVGDAYLVDNLPPLGGAGNPIMAENGLLSRGIVAWRSPNLDFTLGRDGIDYSGGLLGSLLPSPRIPYFDGFHLETRIGQLGMQWIVASIRARKAYAGLDVDPNAGGNTSSPSYPDYGWEDSATGSPTLILETFHRFSWDFGGFVLGGSGHALYSRRNNRIEFIDILPVVSWHQTQLLETNMSLVFDGRWTPQPGLAAAFHLGFDDANSGLVGIRDSEAVTITAMVGGIEWKPPESAFSLYGEAGYTHVLWGNFDGSTASIPYVNTLSRAIYRYPIDSGAILLPLTSPYGPGARWGRLVASLDRGLFGFQTGVDFLFLLKTESANLVTTPYFTGISATEASQAVSFFSLECFFSYEWEGVAVKITPAMNYREGKTGFFTRLAIGYRIGGPGLFKY